MIKFKLIFIFINIIDEIQFIRFVKKLMKEYDNKYISSYLNIAPGTLNNGLKK